MSADKKGGGGFNPSYTLSQFQILSEFFKKFLAENRLIKASIIAAGLGAVLEVLHIAWLALRFLLKF